MNMIFTHPYSGFGPGLVNKNYYKNIYVDPKLPFITDADGIKVNVLPNGVKIKKYRAGLFLKSKQLITEFKTILF